MNFKLHFSLFILIIFISQERINLQMTLIYLETKKYLTTDHPTEKEQHKKNHYTKEPYTNTNTKEHAKEQEPQTKEPNI